MTNDEIKEFLDFIKDKFESFGEFREFYATTVYPNERRLSKEMWKEKSNASTDRGTR